MPSSLVCTLAVCKEERTDFEEKIVDVADPKTYTCKSTVSILYEQCFVIFLKNPAVIDRISHEKPFKLLRFSTQ